ncbi:MAG: hypothetical protein V7746_21245, partial [Halioglobus sp.]
SCLLLSTTALPQENASSPLSKVRNTDVKLRYFDVEGADRLDYAVEGAMMLSPKLKFRYEARYWETDITGKDTSGMESARAKGIYFPGEGKWGNTPYRLAVGAEVKVHFDNEDKGIGQDSNTLLPFIGAALILRPGTTLIPLLQHELDFDGEDVNVTSFRLLALQTLPNDTWFKLDAILAVDWENDRETPSFAELQYGHQFTPTFGVYAEGMVGIGGYKPYDWGLGMGIRFVY